MATNLYYIEVTDTYGGEANFSWVTRHIIKAKTLLGAVQRFSKLSGMSWHCVDSYCEPKRFDSRSGATCYFIQGIDAEELQSFYKLRLDTDESKEA